MKTITLALGAILPKISKPALQKAETAWKIPQVAACSNPKSGKNRRVRINAPVSWMAMLPSTAHFCSRTTLAISLTLRAWAITILCRRPSFLFSRKITVLATDIKPRPPISIRHKITI